MAEGFETVRTIRQHLRRSAALLDEGRIDDAFAAVDAALALDPESLPAQALRDRIRHAQASPTPAAPTDSPIAPIAPPPTTTGTRPFVPQGVNAASWRGFEQRITERRFKALLDAINTSIVDGDAAAARAALEEARELRPDAAELAAFETRVAAVPIRAPLSGAASGPRIWMRAMGAAALFLVGVSLLLGLEWMRPEEPPAPKPVVAPELPAVAPPPDRRPAPAPNLGAVPVALNEEESVPAIETPPEPLLRPSGTSGAAPAEAIADAAPVEAPRAALAMQPMTIRQAAPPAVERTIERRVDEMDVPVRTAGEIPDEFVASSRSAAVAPPLEGPASPVARAADVPVAASTVGRVDAPESALAATSAVVLPPMERTRVEEVLRRYARAYGDLDVDAARAVWPTVDEKALVRAFQNLASQRVSFDDCDIAIDGVSASASCRGEFSFVGKVGSREPRTESRMWRFELRRAGDAWKIEGVDARRAQALDVRP